MIVKKLMYLLKNILHKQLFNYIFFAYISFEGVHSQCFSRAYTTHACIKSHSTLLSITASVLTDPLCHRRTPLHRHSLCIFSSATLCHVLLPSLPLSFDLWNPYVGFGKMVLCLKFENGAWHNFTSKIND